MVRRIKPDGSALIAFQTDALHLVEKSLWVHGRNFNKAGRAVIYEVLGELEVSGFFYDEAISSKRSSSVISSSSLHEDVIDSIRARQRDVIDARQRVMITAEDVVGEGICGELIDLQRRLMGETANLGSP